MNVQLILVQAGIELVREVIQAPVTKRLLAEAICKISSGSLCPLFYDFETDTWKKSGGEYPTLIVHGVDSDGDETTLSCSVEFARIIAKGFKRILESLDLSRNHQMRLFAFDPEELGESLISHRHSFDSPLTDLDAFEEFVHDELFGANQSV